MAPIPIEDAIKEEGELCRLSGDNRKHLAVIITLKTVHEASATRHIGAVGAVNCPRAG